MHITIEHYRDQFNVSLSSAQGKEPFVTIKGCRVMSGNKGRWISFPAKKLDSGKWWNHVYASDGFQEAILQAMDAQPEQRDTRTHAEQKRAPMARDDAARARQTRVPDDSDIPF